MERARPNGLVAMSVDSLKGCARKAHRPFKQTMLVGGGQCWSALVSVGQRWSVLVSVGQRWSVLVSAGRRTRGRARMYVRGPPTRLVPGSTAGPKYTVGDPAPSLASGLKSSFPRLARRKFSKVRPECAACFPVHKTVSIQPPFQACLGRSKPSLTFCAPCFLSAI